MGKSLSENRALTVGAQPFNKRLSSHSEILRLQASSSGIYSQDTSKWTNNYTSCLANMTHSMCRWDNSSNRDAFGELLNQQRAPTAQ